MAVPAQSFGKLLTFKCSNWFYGRVIRLTHLFAYLRWVSSFYYNVRPNLTSFEQQLDSSRGAFPLVVGYNPQQKPFSSTDNPGFLHAITITGFDQSTGNVQYSDPEYGSRKSEISAEKMFDALHMAPTDDEIFKKASSVKSWIEHPPFGDKSVAGKTLYDFLDFTPQSQRAHVAEELQNRWCQYRKPAHW